MDPDLRNSQFIQKLKGGLEPKKMSKHRKHDKDTCDPAS